MKAVLFDLDGTLIDSFDAHILSYKKALEKFDLPVKEDAIRKDFGLIAEDILRKEYPDLSEEKVRGIVGLKRKFFVGSCLSEIKLFPGVFNVLSKLKSEGFLLALCTSSSKKEALEILDYFQIADFFRVVVGGDEIENPKPAPDILLKACERLSVSTKDSVFVGDSVFDEQAGKKAGIKFFMVDPEGPDFSKLLKEL